MSSSSKDSRYTISSSTWPMTASTGTDSANALCIAITRLAAPGPREAMQTAGRPAPRANPSAM